MNAWLAILLAASLPTFEEIRRADRERRTTGQLQTAESVRLTQADASLVATTASRHGNDPEILWGAAELLTDWPAKKAAFESALRAGGTNVAVALRFACAAAHHADFDVAKRWLPYCEQNDATNAAPWIAELWIVRQQRLTEKSSGQPGPPPTEFRDYGVEATRGRIQVLEAAGYSPYAARRLGFNPESVLLLMMTDVSKPPVADTALPLLQEAAKAMQRHPTFLVTELVGQSVERSLLAQQKGAFANQEIASRIEEMDNRRQGLMNLVAGIERDTIDLATESQMVNYYDTVLSLGEEAAMNKLATTVRHRP